MIPSKCRLLIIFLNLILSVSFCCTGRENTESLINPNSQSDIHSIYIVNNYMHTGIIIPVENESIHVISSLKYFRDYNFIDIGWGEEKFYQDPNNNICMGARAILLPNTSVIRIEGCSAAMENFILWSDFTVRLSLTTEQYMKLLDFIGKSFIKGSDDESVITSSRHSGEIIFFKSVYRYHLFNTCNTWVAKALQKAGLDVSPTFIITARQFYNKIKDQGTVIKPLK